MSNLEINTQIQNQKNPIIKSLKISVPIFLLTALILGNGKNFSDIKQTIAVCLTWFFINAIFFLIVHTGKMTKYRLTLFVLLAVCFIIAALGCQNEFVPIIVGIINSSCNSGDIFNIFSTIINSIYLQKDALSGLNFLIAISFLWVVMSIAVGRGFCSWACMLGGIDEFFSKLLKKPVIKSIESKWRYFPYAVILAMILLCVLPLINPSETGCSPLCPLYSAHGSGISIKALVPLIMLAVFIITFLVVLPLLTKKRIFCGFICPVGALQSMTNKISMFNIGIDKEKCNNCGKCIKECPTLSLDEESLEKGQALLSCTKCGQCIEDCSNKAICFNIKGSAGKKESERINIPFLYLSSVFFTIIGGPVIFKALMYTLNFIKVF